MAEAAAQAYRVRATRCDHRSSQSALEAALERITAPLDRAWEKLAAAKLIALKVNLVWPPEKIRRQAGRFQELVDPAVLRAVLTLLRRRTSARLVVADTTLLHDTPHPGADVHFLPLLAEFGAEFVQCNDRPSRSYDVPGGGLMFRRYNLHPIFAAADQVVSVATLKSHLFMGVTLTTKNLFGLPPIHPDNRGRTYFHHIIRLPYVLPDLARIVQPALGIVDGLVGQSGREWGGEARISDTLLAGDHPIATDLCGAYLMGCDPYGDWPTAPFRRDRNHLRVAVESGFGPASLEAIDFEHDLTVPVGAYDTLALDSPETVRAWRVSMCQQALHYRDRRAEFEARYPREYIYLQDGEVLWHDPYPPGPVSRRSLSGARKDSAIWLKYVDPDDWEGEHFEVYEQELARLGDPAG